MQILAKLSATEVVTLTTAIVSIVVAAVSLTISTLNYLRDKPKVKVSLQWDMVVTRGRNTDPRKRVGCVVVTNLGRRPVFIHSVWLKLPKAVDPPLFLIAQSMSGIKLGEGDAARPYEVNQELLKQYALHWRKLRAMAVDSAGKEYYSKPAVSKVPSWVKPSGQE
jgi:hypothetical protein